MEDVTPSPPYDGRRAAVVAVLGVTVLVTLLVTWGATIGPGTVLDGEGFGSLGSATPTPTDSTPTATAGRAEGIQEQGELPLILKVLALGMAVLGAVALLGLVVLAAWYLWSQRPRRRSRREEVAFDVLDSPDSADAIAAAMADDAAHQMELLRGGTPRNGVVACWARFEDQAARAGVRPETWETSSEFALRILGMVEADTSAVSALAILFREARFSEHELTEQQRVEAITLLAQIHASLGRRTEVGS